MTRTAEHNQKEVNVYMPQTKKPSPEQMAAHKIVVQSVRAILSTVRDHYPMDLDLHNATRALDSFEPGRSFGEAPQKAKPGPKPGPKAGGSVTPKRIGLPARDEVSEPSPARIPGTPVDAKEK